MSFSLTTSAQILQVSRGLIHFTFCFFLFDSSSEESSTSSNYSLPSMRSADSIVIIFDFRGIAGSKLIPEKTLDWTAEFLCTVAIGNYGKPSLLLCSS